MSEPDLFAEAILDVPDLSESTVLGRITGITRTYMGADVTGAARVTVAVGSEEMDCDWLRSFAQSIVAGAATEGSLVLVHLTGGQCVIADVIVLGAKFVG